MQTLTNIGAPLINNDGSLMINAEVSFILVDFRGRATSTVDAVTQEFIHYKLVKVQTDDNAEFSVDLWPTSRGINPVYYLCRINSKFICIGPLIESLSPVKFADFVAEAKISGLHEPFAQHLMDNVRHVTTEDRERWDQGGGGSGGDSLLVRTFGNELFNNVNIWGVTPWLPLFTAPDDGLYMLIKAAMLDVNITQQLLDYRDDPGYSNSGLGADLGFKLPYIDTSYNDRFGIGVGVDLNDDRLVLGQNAFRAIDESISILKLFKGEVVYYRGELNSPSINSGDSRATTASMEIDRYLLTFYADGRIPDGMVNIEFIREGDNSRIEDNGDSTYTVFVDLLDGDGNNKTLQNFNGFLIERDEFSVWSYFGPDYGDYPPYPWDLTFPDSVPSLVMEGGDPGSAPVDVDFNFTGDVKISKL